MRTVCTDIMMICKGWGVSVISREEALKDYIGLFTGCDISDVSDNTVLHFLSHSVKKFIGSNRLIEALNTNAESYSYKDMPIVTFLTKLYINLLIDRVVTDLNLSDYDEIIKYCKVADNFTDANKPTYFTMGCKIRPWWRYFDSMNVEDDRKW